MNLAQARAVVRLLEIAAAHPIPDELLDPSYGGPAVTVASCDHGDGHDLEVALSFYSASLAKLPAAIYLSGLGAWHAWDGETNEERPINTFAWRTRTAPRRGWALCALAADGTILTPYLPEEATDGNPH